jgi:predicted dehydrogenase/threonine dehydrogenase-like Zn-dependent dehydrogenase
MKQVTQRLRDGRIEVMDVPRPVLLPEGAIIDVRASLVSAGTERSTVEAGQKNLIGKARARPEQARAVLDRARTEGVRPTVDAVRRRLEAPSALGYSSSGVVLEVGAAVHGLRPGDRVACGGGGHATHAELNYVPGNLCAKLPENVSFEAGAFTTVGSIAMHAVRQAEASLGERVGVIGLGLVGQLTCRLLSAAGCQVVGVDLDGELVERARAFGSEAHPRSQLNLDSLPAPLSHLDAAIVTASTESDDPVRLAGALVRDRGRVVVVGAVGMNVPRATYYGKEVELRLSRSYGPGRYDADYEERGLDYPIGYVRWTEQRNMAAFVELLSSARITVDDLITETVPVEEASSAYERLMHATSSPLGLLITYPREPATAAPSPGLSSPRRPTVRRAGAPSVGVIGAGSFAQRLLIPGLREAGFELSLVASATGLSAADAAQRFTFARAVEPEQLLDSAELDAVAIASRHASHAGYAIAGLERDKAVFVEKPPALSFDELDRLRVAASGRVLQVGFNRRHAPLAVAMRDYIATSENPRELLYRVAAGRLREDHWLNDPRDGGGRLLGEGCHFVDFACWLMGALPDQIRTSVPASPSEVQRSPRFAITLTFPGQSIATILYGSESSSRIGKELIEVHSAGKSATLSDYRRLELRGDGPRKTLRNGKADKGHAAQFSAFRRAMDGHDAGGPSPLDTMETTLRAFEAARSDRDGPWS